MKLQVRFGLISLHHFRWNLQASQRKAWTFSHRMGQNPSKVEEIKWILLEYSPGNDPVTQKYSVDFYNLSFSSASVFSMWKFSPRFNMTVKSRNKKKPPQSKSKQLRERTNVSLLQRQRKIYCLLVFSLLLFPSTWVLAHVVNGPRMCVFLLLRK